MKEIQLGKKNVKKKIIIFFIRIFIEIASTNYVGIDQKLNYQLLIGTYINGVLSKNT